MALHVEYCRGFGISKKEIEESEESQGESSIYIPRHGINEVSSLHRIY
jgi:hypothetical protein